MQVWLAHQLDPKVAHPDRPALNKPLVKEITSAPIKSTNALKIDSKTNCLLGKKSVLLFVVFATHSSKSFPFFFQQSLDYAAI